MPLISVIVPVYKVEKYLHRCVDSILKQTFRDFELILVDDGSPDNCGAICDEYARKDKRVYVIHQENCGLSAARNIGLDWMYDNSDSTWISFIDSDDWVHERYLELLLKAVEEDHVSVAICGCKITRGNEPLSIRELRIRECPTENFYCENYMIATVAWGKIYHKECFTQFRYPVGKCHEDEYVTYRIIFQYDTISYVDAELYAYYINEEGITRSQWNLKRLDVILAREYQIEFFKKNNCKEAYATVCKKYCNDLATAIRRMTEQHIQKKEIGFYRKKLRIALVKFGHITGVKFTENNYWIYDNAYPKLMSPFWRLLSIRCKVMRTFHLNC